MIIVLHINLEISYRYHLILKKAGRDAKTADKMAKSSDFVSTMNMQSVLQAPKNKVVALYYKTKLVVHHLTLCNNRSQEACCFLCFYKAG